MAYPGISLPQLVQNRPVVCFSVCASWLAEMGGPGIWPQEVQRQMLRRKGEREESTQNEDWNPEEPLKDDAEHTQPRINRFRTSNSQTFHEIRTTKHDWHYQGDVTEDTQPFRPASNPDQRQFAVCTFLALCARRACGRSTSPTNYRGRYYDPKDDHRGEKAEKAGKDDNPHTRMLSRARPRLKDNLHAESGLRPRL